TIATFGFLARGNEAMVEGARFCASTQSRPDAHNARGHRAREALRKWVELWVRSLNGLESRRIYHSIAENLRHARCALRGEAGDYVIPSNPYGEISGSSRAWGEFSGLPPRSGITAGRACGAEIAAKCGRQLRDTCARARGRHDVREKLG